MVVPPAMLELTPLVIAAPPAPTVIVMAEPTVTAKPVAVRRPPAPPPPEPEPLPEPPPPATTRYSTVVGAPDKGLNVADKYPPNKLLIV
jgi:hypothetical protein